MIFVTVGTHEQQFDRLLKEIENLVEKKVIQEEVIIQSGFCNYIPSNCVCENIISFSKMNELISSARIVITHGGPSSFLAPVKEGKIPIVVPRQKKFGEHVNDHQKEFCCVVAERLGNIIVIDNISDLGNAILHYEEITNSMIINDNNNNESFCSEFGKIINELF